MPCLNGVVRVERSTGRNPCVLMIHTNIRRVHERVGPRRVKFLNMSVVTAPVSRSNARALIVAGSTSRAPLVSALQKMNFVCAEVDDPFVAMAELCRRPLAYRAVMLSLAGLYREELAIIGTIKARFPHVEVWLTHLDGRHASLAEATRLGADALLADDGLHRIAMPPSAKGVTRPTTGTTDAPLLNGNGHKEPEVRPAIASPVVALPSAFHDKGGTYHAIALPRPGEASRDDDDANDTDFSLGEPVLTAEELRALLQEQPASADDD